MDRKRGPEPSLRAQWLGHQLRDLREAAGLTLKDAGEYVQRDPSTVSRIEAGTVPARTADVLMLCNLYGVDDANRRDALEKLSRDVWRKGWWESYADYFTEGFIDHAWLEDRACAIRSFEALVLPGLLQTEEYARTMIRTVDPDASSAQVERWVDFRMQRQRVLAKDDPPRFEAVLDEPTLRRPVGGADVMCSQLNYVLECAKQDNVDIRVFPVRAGAHPGSYGAFTVYELPEPFPAVAYADTLAGTVYVESEDAQRFVSAYEQLYTGALGPEESRTLVSAAVADLS